MCCRVEKFLCCIPLEGFGIFIGWFNLIVLIIATCFVALFTVLSLVTAGLGPAVLCAICFVILLTLAHYTKEFIEGINEHNHERMVGYRVICIFGLVFSTISAAVVILTTLLSRNQSYRRDHEFMVTGTSYRYELSPMEAVVDTIVSLAVEIYLFICINSLYLDIKESGRYNQTQIPASNIFISQQPQPVMAVNASSQSPPSYHAAMQQQSHGTYTTQVVIPMQNMYPEISSFKPQAV